MGEVHDNKDHNRFELAVAGYTAHADYVIDSNVITFTHTIVPPELEGQGIASRLIKAALEDARGRGLKVVPQCPFVAAYIDKHPEWREILG